MHNNFICELNLDFEINTDGVEEIIAGYTNTTQYMIFPYPRQALDKNLIDFLDKFDLRINHHEVLYTPPNSKLPIHVDMDSFSNMVKLNWVMGATGSNNVWWKTKNADKLKYHTTPTGTKYLLFDETEVDELFRYPVGKSTFVNAGIPHSVDNPTNEGRWCLSHCIVFNDDSSIQMLDAYNIFKDHLKTND